MTSPSPDLAQVANDLYALPPASFRATRDERAAQARAGGDKVLAAAIGKLRRPTVSAWLVNQLAREAPDQLARLLDLAEPLRQAQQALAGDRLRELSGQRRQLVAALTREAVRLAGQAGQPVSAQAEREVDATLEAAVADPAAASAVRSGQLASALAYAGLGGIETADSGWPGVAAQEAPGARPGTAGPRGTQGAARPRARETAAQQRRAQDAAAAHRDLRTARAAAEEAGVALDRAEQEVASTRERHRAAEQVIEDLERQLAQAQAQSGQAARAVRDARRARDAAARSLEGAQRRLARAQERASAHPDQPAP